MKKSPSYNPKKKIKTPVFNSRRDRDALYDSEWYAYRTVFLKYNPRCYSCGEKSQAVDHIVAHKGDKKLFKDTKNHIPLCHRCHNTITALFDKHEKPLLVAKLEWLTLNRKMLGTENIKVVEMKRYGKEKKKTTYTS